MNYNYYRNSSSRLWLVPILLLICCFSCSITAKSMADSSGAVGLGVGGEAKVHIVYTEKPDTVEPEDFNIRTLASVLGSEDAAKEALVYHYKHAASGFSAKLTPAQVEQLSKQPGVLQVVPSQKMQLHRPVGLH